MSKTTPEEAGKLAEKHGLILWGRGPSKELAALIDEAVALKAPLRGVDAEPVAWMMEWPNHSPSLTIDPTDYLQNERKFLIPLYTHPAPSQPAEPEWIDDPHDIEQGLMRNPKWKPSEPAAPASTWQDLEAEQQAAPVELPVVGWIRGSGLQMLKDGYAATLYVDERDSNNSMALVKLSDAQAAIEAGRKAS